MTDHNWARNLLTEGVRRYSTANNKLVCLTVLRAMQQAYSKKDCRDAGFYWILNDARSAVKLARSPWAVTRS